MSTTNKNTITKKTISRTLIIACAALYILYCFVFAPLYTYLSSDIAFMLTVLPELVGFLADIVDIVAYAFCFATMIYSIYRFSLKDSKNVILTVLVAFFVKYVANCLMTFIIDGVVNLQDITSVILYYLLDAFWLLVVILSSNSIIRKYHERRAKLNKAAANLDVKLGDEYQVFPFKRFINKNNPLQRSALVMGILMGSVHMLSRIVYDIFYGLPSSLTDALWMTTYYLSDIISAFVMYVIALFIFMKYNDKENKISELYQDV